MLQERASKCFKLRDAQPARPLRNNINLSNFRKQATAKP